MQRKIFTAFLVLLLCSNLFAQTIHNNGTHIVSQSGSYWVIDNGNFTLKSESATNLATMANLKIEADASLTLTPQSYVTVSGTLTNSSGTDGLVLRSTVDGTSSLIQSTNGVNATINRYVTGSTNLAAMKYHFVSVPLMPSFNSTANLLLGAYLYQLDVASDSWQSYGTSTTSPLDETKGYMVYYPAATHTFVFEGPINAGSFSPTVVYAGQGNNLVPNPYPSAIDWDAASGWTKTNIANSVYVWPSGETEGNYATWIDGVGVNNGSRYIPAGQSFIVNATASSPVLTMNDNVRVHNSQAFYKGGGQIADLLRIKAEANNYADEVVVRFTENATTTADPDFDAWKLTGLEAAPQLYTLAGDAEKLSINSLPYLETAYSVPMNFELSVSKPVTLTFSETESFDPSVTIFLKDNLTGQTMNVRTQPEFSFNHNPANAAGRFTVLFGGAIGVEEPLTETQKMWIADNILFINIPELSGQQALLEVFNTSGNRLMTRSLVLNELTTTYLNLEGFVIVKLTTGQKVLTTKGILMK